MNSSYESKADIFTFLCKNICFFMLNNHLYFPSYNEFQDTVFPMKLKKKGSAKLITKSL